VTRLIHDQFAKDLMEDLLRSFGEVKAPRRVPSETRHIDVWFVPQVRPEALQPLGLLGRMVQNTAILEPFRNAAHAEEICSCLLKSLEVRSELNREAERTKTKLVLTALPTLWILTPTASNRLLAGFRALEATEQWPAGIHFLAETLKTAIVAIHQLPRTPETLWLRLLGRGRVQEQAIKELEVLPAANPFRSKALELVLSLQRSLESQQDADRDDRELIMRLSPLYLQEKEQSRQEGIQQGAQANQRTIIENLLKSRFGAIDSELATVVNPMMALSPEAFAALILQLSALSREDLLARFNHP